MFSTQSDKNSFDSFQSDLITLEKWAITWNMNFNTAKCNVMVVGNRNTISTDNLKYTLCGDALSFVDSTKYLGVEISNCLKWENHINKGTSKAYKILGLLRSALGKAPTNVKLLAC